jgi:hypothetical protein
VASKKKNIPADKSPKRKGEAPPVCGRPVSTGSSAPSHEPRTLEQSIGHHIRQQRRRLELTGGHLATSASISTSMLSKIENGQISSDVTGIERRGTKSGHRYHLLGHSRSNDVIVEPYYITLSQDAQPYTAFRHEGMEIIYMLTGKVAYRHGDTTYTMEPGDTLFFDATAAHGPEELLVLPMSYLSIIIYRRC